MASVDVHNISISSFPSSLSLAATTSVVISKLRVCVCSFVFACLFVGLLVHSFGLFVCLLVFRMRVHNEKVSSSIRRKHSEDRGG